MKGHIVKVFVLGGLFCFSVFTDIEAVKFDVSRQRSSDGKCTYAMRCLTDDSDTASKDIVHIASMRIVVKRVVAELDIEAPLPLATVRGGRTIPDIPHYDFTGMFVQGTGGIMDTDARLDIVVKTRPKTGADGSKYPPLPPLYGAHKARREDEEEKEEEQQCGNEVFTCEMEYITGSGHTDVIAVKKFTATSWVSDLGRGQGEGQGQAPMSNSQMEALMASLLDTRLTSLEANVLEGVSEVNDKVDAWRLQQDRKLDAIARKLEALSSREKHSDGEVSSSTAAALASITEEVKALQERFSNVEGVVEALDESMEQQMVLLNSKLNERDRGSVLRHLFAPDDCPKSSPSVEASVKGLDGKLDKFMASYEQSVKLTNELITAPDSCANILSTNPRVLAVLSPGFSVLCDTVSYGGGWIVIQRRTTGNLDMNKNWKEYKDGFGDVKGDFWLGNEKIHRLTFTKPHELLINLKYKGKSYHARYANFQVLTEEENYTLRVSNYTGSAGDSLTVVHDGKPFSTYDRDNDLHQEKNCAELFESGWWHSRCFQANLNVAWSSLSLNWYTLTAYNSTLDYTEMKIRPTMDT